MHRLACVNLPALPLQLLFQIHPEWRTDPAAVVTVNRPTGRIVYANRDALGRGVRPGMRYATALTVAPGLRGDTVSEHLQEKKLDEVVSSLRRFAPKIEACTFDPGTLWIGAQGLLSLYESLPVWMDAIRSLFEREGYRSRIAVGYSRFGSYLAARSDRTAGVVQNPEEERHIVLSASLGLLPLSVRVRQRLSDLGLRTIREFLQLPKQEVASRLGAETAEIHRLALGEFDLPSKTVEEEPEFIYTTNFVTPLCELDGVMAHLGTLIERLINDVVQARRAVVRICVALGFEGGATERQRIIPTKPTIRYDLLHRLTHLRLQSLSFPGRLEAVGLTADTVEHDIPQGDLFVQNQSREWSEAMKALALIRAEFGNRSVTIARTRKGYLPEEQFSWIDAPLGTSVRRSPHNTSENAGTECGPFRLVRRFLAEPRALDGPPSGQPLGGPFCYSGGWWSDAYDRTYYYTGDDRGRPLLVYYDHPGERWMLQGAVQ